MAEGRFWLSRLLAGALAGRRGPRTRPTRSATSSYWSGDTAAAVSELRGGRGHARRPARRVRRPRPDLPGRPRRRHGPGRRGARTSSAVDRRGRPVRHRPAGRGGDRDGLRAGRAGRPGGRQLRGRARSSCAAAAARPSSWPRRCRPRRWCAGRSATWTRRAATSPRRCRCSPGPAGSPGWSCCRRPPGSRWPTVTSTPPSSWGPAADADASDLGIDRELPLIRCVSPGPCSAGGDVAGGRRRRRAGRSTAARSLTFTFPMALCLETAALIVPAGRRGRRPGQGELPAAGRRRGQPCPRPPAGPGNAVRRRRGCPRRPADAAGDGP